MSRAATSKASAAYQGAMEAILAIPIAIGIGYMADRVLETEPVGLIIGAVVGFAAFVLRLWRMRELVDEAADEAQTEPQRSVAERSEDRETILGGTDRRASDDDDRPTETADDDPTDR